MSDIGWAGLEPQAGDDAAPSHLPPSHVSVARLFARVFAGANGDAAMAYLAALTLARCLGPDATDSALRMLEGQRALVLHIQSLVRRGRDGQ